MKRVAVINDLSGLGRCSLTAAIPVLSVMGVQACPLPTAILTNQTGFDSFYCDDYTDKIDIYCQRWRDMNITFDCITTGYFAGESQISKVINFIKEFKTDKTLLIVDPVMGDNGGIYATYTKALCEQVKGLVSHADVITPNLTELCVLTGTDYESLNALQSDKAFFEIIEKQAAMLLNSGVGAVIVTGMTRGEFIYNGVFTKDDPPYYKKSKAYGGRYSGTGDLFSSIISGAAVRGDSLKSAVSLAADFLEKAVADTINDGTDPNHGVNFEKFLKLLA